MLSAEARLVFRTADPTLSNAECTEIVREVRDWERVLALVEREAAASPVWRAVRAGGVTIPAEVAEVLRAQAMQRDLRMQRLAQRLQTTIRVFADRGVPVMLLKGSAYGALFDPTLRSRSMNDVDLLVRRDDVEPAKEAVIAAGWPLTRDPGLLELLADAHHLPHFVDPQDPGSRLELHVALLPDDQPFAFEEQDLWREARPAPTPFEGALVPSPEHLLVHTAIHFAWQHTMTFGAWRTIRVVAALAAMREFDWERFLALARGARAGTSAYWTLRLASSLCGIEARGDVMARLAPPTPNVILDALERHFVASIAVGERPRSPSVKLSRLLWLSALRPRWSGHPEAGRSDPENRWAARYGVASTEKVGARLARHLRSLRDWTSFLARTLLGRA
jgi:hypothetical protein